MATVERQMEVYSAPRSAQENWAYDEAAIYRVDHEVPVTLQDHRIGSITVRELL